MLCKNTRSCIALALICSTTQVYTTDDTHVISITEEVTATQRCSDESCPCSTSCRCTENCRCRTTGCRGCCEIYTQDQELNKSGTATCVASHCDCTSECAQDDSCCNH